ncbi:MAG: selenocysteine-specific translation elongation factor [Planctomycetes bacterium]|jgi:selenocysteine-specific elongation factor|nr:selenocysteine-specific translation elongation factor [Planctomycetota bacterium]
MAEVVPIMVGTAGHVDHGKTTLLKHLLGGAPEADRLPEERERGLTIDIGYAEMDLGDGRVVGFVDVPGHERFVRNMVAAASGIDLILLVVAADDGVMPQTREHLEIAGLMGARSGFTVLTKIDLVDEELRLAAEEELRALLDASFLRGAPIVPVSAITGEGLDDLRHQLIACLSEVGPRDAEGVFRLPVQRSFALPGHGTVVTGVPLAGRVRLGDLLEVVPGRKACRVRGIQAYHREVEEGRAGHRTALKLSDVSWRDVRRGNVVAEPGRLAPSNLIDARLSLLPRVGAALESNRPVRVHCGTDEVLGRVFLLSTRKLRPGEDALVQLRLDRPVVTAPGDRFVLRLPSPQTTLGGGRVIGASTGKVSASRARLVRYIAEREAGLEDPVAAVRSLLSARGLDAPTFEEIAKELVRRREEVELVVTGLAASGEALVLSERVLAAGPVEEGRRRLREALSRFHRAEPLRAAAPRAPLREKLGVTDAVFSFLISGDSEIEVVDGGRIRLRSFAPALGEEQTARLSKVEALLREAKFATPRDAELPGLVGGEPPEIARLLDLLRDRGDVVLLAGGVLFHRDAVEEARRSIARFIREKGRLVPSDLKLLFGMSRKYSIPLLEYLDQQRFTIRRGDERILA